MNRRDQRRRDHLRNARDRHAPAEGACRHDQYHDDAGCLGGVDEDFRQVLQLQRAIYDESEEERVQIRHRCCFGRREETAEHSTQKDHRREQRPDAFLERDPYVAQTSEG